MADDTSRSVPEEPSEAEELEIELYGEPESVAQFAGEVLRITYRDIADSSDEASLPGLSELRGTGSAKKQRLLD